jgi:hypothetical protein
LPTVAVAGGVTYEKAGIAQTGYLPFPQFATSVTDDFNRANEDPILGNGWHAESTARIVSNVLKPPAAGSGLAKRSAANTSHEMVVEISGLESGDQVNWYENDSENLYGLVQGDTPTDYADLQYAFDRNIEGLMEWSLADGDAMGFRITSFHEELWVRISGIWHRVLYASRISAAPSVQWALGLSDQDLGQEISADNFRLAAVTEASLVGDGMKASGDANVVFAKTGIAISAFVASGEDTVTFAEAGFATAPFVASGADVIESAETGAGIANFVASGTALTGATYEKLGLAAIGP